MRLGLLLGPCRTNPRPLSFILSPSKLSLILFIADTLSLSRSGVKKEDIIGLSHRWRCWKLQHMGHNYSSMDQGELPARNLFEAPTIDSPPLSQPKRMKVKQGCLGITFHAPYVPLTNGQGKSPAPHPISFHPTSRWNSLLSSSSPFPPLMLTQLRLILPCNHMFERLGQSATAISLGLLSASWDLF